MWLDSSVIKLQKHIHFKMPFLNKYHMTIYVIPYSICIIIILEILKIVEYWVKTIKLRTIKL